MRARARRFRSSPGMATRSARGSTRGSKRGSSPTKGTSPKAPRPWGHSSHTAWRRKTRRHRHIGSMANISGLCWGPSRRSILRMQQMSAPCRPQLAQHAGMRSMSVASAIARSQFRRGLQNPYLGPAPIGTRAIKAPPSTVLALAQAIAPRLGADRSSGEARCAVRRVRPLVYPRRRLRRRPPGRGAMLPPLRGAPRRRVPGPSPLGHRSLFGPRQRRLQVGRQQHCTAASRTLARCVELTTAPRHGVMRRRRLRQRLPRRPGNASGWQRRIIISQGSKAAPGVAATAAATIELREPQHWRRHAEARGHIQRTLSEPAHVVAPSGRILKQVHLPAERSPTLPLLSLRRVTAAAISATTVAASAAHILRDALGRPSQELLSLASNCPATWPPPRQAISPRRCGRRSRAFALLVRLAVPLLQIGGCHRRKRRPRRRSCKWRNLVEGRCSSRHRPRHRLVRPRCRRHRHGCDRHRRGHRGRLERRLRGARRHQRRHKARPKHSLAVLVLSV